MKKGLKITAITVGSILVLMLLLPFAFQGKMEKIISSTLRNWALVFSATSPKRLLLSIISG